MSVLSFYRQHPSSLIIFLTCLMHTLCTRAQAVEKNSYCNAVMKSGIKSVQLYQADDPLSMPIIELNSEECLLLKFDDLSSTRSDYHYTILHCDANWQESQLMQGEYLNGFFDNPLNDMASSFNTQVEYANYLLQLPNNDISFRYSGNYILIVYERENRQNVVLTRRFFVVEPQVSISARMKPATFDAYQGDNQEVDFELDFSAFQLNDPKQEVKTVLMKNRRWDSAVRKLKPRNFQGKILSYNYDEENVFPGGNEYRYFDLRSWKYTGEGVEAMQELNGFQHITLQPDELRSNKKYFYYAEMNGQYRVESQDREKQNYDTDCDYGFVHFTLKIPTPLLGGKIYLFGELTNQELKEDYVMKWDMESRQYELSLLLKQGYYNYQYVYVHEGKTQADERVVEGAFYEAENDYQLLVYYRKLHTDRYDRLVGYRQINTLHNRNAK